MPWFTARQAGHAEEAADAEEVDCSMLGTLLRHHEPGFAVLDLDAREVVFYGFGPAGFVEVERCSLGSR